mmetsp:Transcript_54992/g.160485  ORF Transcript_54992/g.160485 Transcript_54992/m.160485 type:complete len:587 (+) Transcript_54992:45-1805(+)
MAPQLLITPIIRTRLAPSTSRVRLSNVEHGKRHVGWQSLSSQAEVVLPPLLGERSDDLSVGPPRKDAALQALRHGLHQLEVAVGALARGDVRQVRDDEVGAAGLLLDEGVDAPRQAQLLGTAGLRGGQLRRLLHEGAAGCVVAQALREDPAGLAPDGPSARYSHRLVQVAGRMRGEGLHLTARHPGEGEAPAGLSRHLPRGDLPPPCPKALAQRVAGPHPREAVLVLAGLLIDAEPTLGGHQCVPLVDVRDLHEDLDVQAEVVDVPLRLLADALGVVTDLVREHEQAGAAAVPHAVLLDQEGQQEQHAAVPHDPPDVHAAGQAVAELGPGRALGDEHCLLEDDSHLHHADESRARLHALPAHPTPLLRPRGKHRVGLEGAQARDLHEAEQAVGVVLRVDHAAEAFDLVPLQEALHGLLAVEHLLLLVVVDKHAALAEDAYALRAADAAHNRDPAPALELRGKAQELRLKHVQDLVRGPVGALLADGCLGDDQDLWAPVLRVCFEVQLLQDVPCNLELQPLEAIAPLHLMRVEGGVAEDNPAEHNCDHGGEGGDGKHHPDAEHGPNERDRPVVVSEARPPVRVTHCL